MSITRKHPLKDTDDPNEQYDEEFNHNSDAADVRGVYLQNDTSNDTSVLVSRDGSDNLTLTDPIVGTKRLQDLTSSGVTYVDWLLEAEPDAVNTTYTPTFTSGKITNETWINTSTTKTLKTVDYTYTGSKVTTEVRKVYDLATGLTIIGQITLNYTYSGSSISSITQTRDV